MPNLPEARRILARTTSGNKESSRLPRRQWAVGRVIYRAFRNCTILNEFEVRVPR